jgi:serine/threonine protein kinase
MPTKIPIDLKLNNIMVSFDSEEVLGDYINSQLDKPVHYKTDYAGRSIYEQHDDFGVVRDIQRTYPQIVDFGSSSIFENFEGEYGVYPIQAPPYRAPEVILGRGWNMSTDIWNFGVLVSVYE